MFRYLTISSGIASVLAGLVAAIMVLQMISPTIAYGMSEPADDTQTQTTEENTQPPAEEPAAEKEEEDDQETNLVAANAAEPTENPESEAAEEATDETKETKITTGDAISALSTETKINTNEVDTMAEEEPDAVLEEDTEPAKEESTGSVEEEPIDDTKPEETFGFITQEDPSLLDIQATNTATSTTAATSSADTGNNTGSGGGAVTIDTGDAIAFADVLNVVNTNIIDSDGLIEFVNETLGYEDFDLRDEFDLTYAKFDTSQSTPICTLDACADDSTNVNLNNSASIDNDVTVIANTGGNEAAGDNASITTGDAYASANIINVANTNIVDSNYLLLVFNNFSSYAGDIVLPNSDFFDSILQENAGVSNVDIDLSNTATVHNEVIADANSGGNEASGGDTSIITGDAGAVSDVTNMVNQNVIGGSSFSMLIRVQGDWSGNITGLPDGLTWRETDRGIEIVSRDLLGTRDSAQKLSVSANNTATINNNVQVYALTGDNKASGKDASVTTGDAYADSSILNVVNTNIISSNWTNLIFTIYGNWSGDLSFGQPDLWLGVSAESADQPIMPGSEVTYTFTVFNHGDVTAPSVTLESLFENGTLTFDDPGTHSDLNTNEQHGWSLGDIRAGETREVSYTARVSDHLDRGTVSALPLTSRVFSTQNDADEEDNEDVVTIYVGKKKSSSDSRRSTFSANFDIEKTASRDLAQPGDTVDYTVTFFNRGGQLYDAMLVDTLENEAGEIIQQQSWPLGEIKNWESITTSYSMEFDSSMATGTYTNYAQLVGFHESQRKKYQRPYESPIASHTLRLGAPAGQVLGISTCPPYLTEYLRYGKNNNSTEVVKLQQFLNNHLHLNLSTSGYFDLATEQGVRSFQQQYRDEILTPWGLERDSGYVYYTTQKKINEIMCGDAALFPLAPDQMQEITSFKKRMETHAQFSLTTEEGLPEPDSVPPAISAVVTPPPVVREQKETPEPAEPQITSPTPPEPPAATNRWDSVRSWWQHLRSGLRSTWQ
jgi:uncharacterized repeat protein (TIGR01451 family)